MQVHPTEIETIIRELPDVVDAAVTGVPDPEQGEVPAACVIRRPGSELTAQDIKDLIKGTCTVLIIVILQVRARSGGRSRDVLPCSTYASAVLRVLSAFVLKLPTLSFSHADRLSDAKQLRGGVVFVDSLPLTSTGKVARTKLGDVVRAGHRE
ncbi:Luciferin 4-monooxygenase [Eumeta japonica]|uniref:Luciferin 4-monooxygenase n=1 Tax=Eumeta variegata TaxID=151549 RepID=A0A4C1SF80_EUMVA|nr:Luciferin 4-monooxygenase [Eumeta japonica]